MQELRKSITEEELIYWAGYYENKFDEERKALQRQKHNSRKYIIKALFIFGPGK